MKKLFALVLFLFFSIAGFAQGSAPEDDSVKVKTKYFIATNSGLMKTPVGIRVGILDRRGGYIGARFGKGSIYEAEGLGTTKVIKVTQGTLFSISAGLILPVYAKKENFRIHAMVGIGYGKWFERVTKNGQTVGGEFETGLVVSTKRFLFTLGGLVLTGDGNSPKKDLTAGFGYRFQ